MEQEIKQKLFTYLSQYISQNKRDAIERVILARTRQVTVVLEDVFQPHNASAVVRSIDCFGVQDLHVVEYANRFLPNTGITRGASQWINTCKYAETVACFNQLKQKGYKIVATTPHKGSLVLHDLPIDQKIALVFGNEAIGLSDVAMEQADCFVTIPMYGFTESFNISVSVALCLYDLTTRLHSSEVPWQLSEKEKIDVRLDWARSIVRGSELLEKKFLDDMS